MVMVTKVDKKTNRLTLLLALIAGMIVAFVRSFLAAEGD